MHNTKIFLCLSAYILAYSESDLLSEQDNFTKISFDFCSPLHNLGKQINMAKIILRITGICSKRNNIYYCFL